MNQFAKISRPLSRAVAGHNSSSQNQLATAGMEISAKLPPFKLFSSRSRRDHRHRMHHSLSTNNSAYDKLLGLGYTAEELQEYHQVFSLFVLDDSGSIGTAELASAMHSIGMNPEQQELENLIDEVDSDGNGKIDFEEFCGVMKRMNKKKVDWDDIIKQCFAVFDRTGAGIITDLEFQYVLRSIGEITDDQVIEGIFAEFDIDGNGLMDYDEFASLVKHYMTEEDVEAFNQLQSNNTS